MHRNSQSAHCSANERRVSYNVENWWKISLINVRIFSRATVCDKRVNDSHCRATADAIIVCQIEFLLLSFRWNSSCALGISRNHKRFNDVQRGMKSLANVRDKSSFYVKFATTYISFCLASFFNANPFAVSSFTLCIRRTEKFCLEQCILSKRGS